MEYLNKVLDAIKKFWDSLDKKYRIYVISGIVGVVIVFAVWIALLTKVTYAELYDSEVDPATISSVETLLQSEGIVYKIAQTGNNILVDVKSVGKARTLIATSDIGTSKYTWKDALDKNTLGLTESEKAMNFKLAAQDTLAADLENIDGVKSATVNLIIPSSDPFALKKTTEAQAAVQVNLTKSLNEKQILGIAKHVMMSVQGLKEENITITDTNANILFPKDGSTIGTATMEYDEIKYTRQKAIEDKVNTLLAPLYDDIRVNVNLQMSFDKYKETNEIITSPLGEDAKVGLISEQHLATEKSENKTTSGEPGLGSNDEDTSYQMQANGDNSSAEITQSDTIYKLNTKVSELEKEIGEVSLADSSISIVVYKNVRHDYDELNKKKTFKDITWEEYKEQKKSEVTKIDIDDALTETIEKATGISSIVITGFATPIFIDKMSGDIDFVGYIPMLIAVLILAVVAIIYIRKNATVTVTETEPELSVENLLYSTKQNTNDLPEIQEYVSDSYKRIAEFIDEKPELVAQLLRNWFNED